MNWRAAFLVVLLPITGACQDGTGPLQGEVAVSFRATPSLQGFGPGSSATVAGANGTLRLDRVLMVVDKFKLEGAEDACLEADDDDELDDCEDFEADPFLLDLELDGDAVTVVQEGVTVGSFSELEFEVEDIDMDDDDDDEGELGELAALIRAQVADWPDGASMLVEGSFTPTGGAPESFRVFVDAEIEVEMEFDEPLMVPEDGRVELTVVLDPTRWFTLLNGNVLDLTDFNFTGDDDDLLELGVKLKEGFTEIEIEIDD